MDKNHFNKKDYIFLFLASVLLSVRSQKANAQSGRITLIARFDTSFRKNFNAWMKIEREGEELFIQVQVLIK